MRYVIIGASAAGISAAEAIRDRDKNGEIIIISKDDKVYSRCMLHHVISGRRDTDGISFISDDFFQEMNIQWISGTEVTKIDGKDKSVSLEDGRDVSYDKLLLANGARAFIPPVKNLREGIEVYPLRDIKDALDIKSIEDGKEIVIMGAGLVGIDAAVGLIEKGIKVHIIEMNDNILPMQLDKVSAKRYEKALLDHGANVYTGVSLKEVKLEEGHVKGVILSDDKEISCSGIVVATGVRSNSEITEGTDIEVDRGICVDAFMETAEKDIFAAGDVCGKTPIWPFANKQGKIAGRNMVKIEEEFNDDFAFRNSMNFFGIETVSLGKVVKPDETFTEEICKFGDVYKKIIHKDGIIYGAIFQGDIEYCGVYMQIIRNKINISGVKERLFRLDFADFYGIKSDGQYEYKTL